MYSTVSKVALAALLISGPAHAETAAVEDSQRLEDILVTAQRRQESAQDVGAALTVITPQLLTDRNVANVNDLENAAPSLEVDSAYGGGQPQFRIRGVGFKDYAANNASTVGVYVDEVAYPYGSLTQGVIYDMERVEVLRGPQGTLYGRNTTGGAVNIITANPTDAFAIGATAEYGRWDRFRAEGFVSGPLTETLKVRVSAVTEQGGAWQTNRATGEKLGDANRFGGRVKLAWEPSADVRFLLNANYARDKSDGLGLYLTDDFITRSGNPVEDRGLIRADTRWGDTGWSLNPDFAKLIGAKPNARPFRDNEQFGVSLTGNIDLGSVLLTSITAYQSQDRGEFNDWDASASREADTYFFGDTKVFSQEVRLSSDSESPLQWVTGLYYSHEKFDGGFYSDFTDAYYPGFFTDTSYGQRVEAIGVFGQASYALTDRLSLIGGLRYEYEKRKLKDFYTDILGRGTTSAPFSTDTDMSEVSGKLGVEYKVGPKALVYANVARGVKSGGFTTYNKASASDDQLLPFKPEVLWAYEVGLKSDLTNTLRLNASLFYYDYKNQQIQASIVSPIYGPIGKMVNAPKTEIYGGELELLWQPLPGLTISQSLGYKHGEFVEFESVDNAATRAARDPETRLYNTVITRDRKGERLPFPRVTYAGQIAYEAAVGAYKVRPEVNYYYRSDLYSTTATSVIDSYWLFNASLTLSPQDGPWSVGVWGRNIFNAHYDETRNQFTNAATASPHEPASYGIRLGIRY